MYGEIYCTDFTFSFTLSAQDVCWLGKDWNENLGFGGKKETWDVADDDDDDDTECKHKCKTVMFVRNKVFRNGVF